jgi:hypothetical protein
MNRIDSDAQILRMHLQGVRPLRVAVGGAASLCGLPAVLGIELADHIFRNGLDIRDAGSTMFGGVDGIVGDDQANRSSASPSSSKLMFRKASMRSL